MLGEIIIVQPGLLLAEGKRGKLPPIGSIVKTQHPIYCIVVSHAIDSKIPGRLPIAYGKSIAELESEEPQVFELMKWMFQIVPFGSLKNEKLFIAYPANAIETHSTLDYATDSEIEKIFADDLSFINFLFRLDKSVIPMRDEAVINFLNKYFSLLPSENREKEYKKVMRHIAMLLKNDYFSLSAIISGVEKP